MITLELDRLGIEGYLEAYRDKSLLRFLTCGSVDDGKSTLIGRLLHDSEQVFEDHMAALRKDTGKYGTTGEAIDFALLVDGLQAEREQGITIDVAYRYFSTDRRKFIIADTPGHVQYTRNMATGASHCDLAIILIDARKGVLEQTRRHAFIATLLGIQHLVVAINKMDLVGYDRQVFDRIRDDFSAFAAKLQVPDVHFIPVSGLKGENVVHRSENMPWYQGSPLLDHLENVHIASDRNLIDTRLPVQQVVRPNLNYRGFAGTIASGVLRKGDAVVALPSGRRSRVKSIDTFDGQLQEAFAGMSVTVTLDDEIDVSRGDVLANVNNAPRVDHSVEAMVVWMGEEPMQAGSRYIIKHMTNQSSVTITDLRYRMNVSTLHKESTQELALNEIGRVRIESMRPLFWDPYAKNRGTGAFILIDRMSNATVGAGMIVDRTPAERAVERRGRAEDAGLHVTGHHSRVTAEQRRARLQQQPFAVWLTGLPRSGKAPIAFALEEELFRRGLCAHVLAGGNMRRTLGRDLGFSGEDRWENQRRTAEVARIGCDAGLISICALVSPLAADRAQARSIIGEGRFLEIYCDAPVEVCEQRDPSGVYAAARQGQLRNVTGVDAPYEPPVAPDLVLHTSTEEPAASVARIVELLAQKGLIPGA
ncbi:MAG: sulfate adenylyltransferase subunit CysN [Planctomycetota bacterium]